MSKVKNARKVLKSFDQPTVDQFNNYQLAYDYFNQNLFEFSLQPCMLNFSRHRGAQGFFAPNRWVKDKQKIHEISLNPDCLYLGLEESMGTLVHEMVHQWQQDYGTPPRRCYHDREWAEKMVEIGLMPSSTGQPGGKATGQKMSHYIMEDGPFIKCLNDMGEHIKLPWISGEKEDKKAPVRSKSYKYICFGCNSEITSKNDVLSVTCDDCDCQFVLKG